MIIIGKVFRKDPYSAVYGIDDNGIVWYISRSARVNHGTISEFRKTLAKGRLRFHAFTEDMESRIVRTKDIVYNWS